MLLSCTLADLLAAPAGQLLMPDAACEQGVCVVIGNFDGVHRGHLALFEAAGQSGLPVVAVTFAPHPREVLSSSAPPRLLSTDDRLQLLASAGARHTLLIAFTREFAALETDVFVHGILCERLRMRQLVIGHDFSLGKGRSGNGERLRELGATLGFEVTQLPCLLTPDGIPVSSTRIRDCLGVGDVDGAAQLLGRAHSVRGTVVHGFRRGHDLGFPTANLDPTVPGMEAIGLALPGVYATRVVIPGPDGILPPISLTTRPTGPLEGGACVLPAVTSIGHNKTFGRNALSVETHIPNFSRELYDLPIELAFLHRLRDERKFNGIEELKAQIRRDTDEALRLAR